MDTLGLPLGAVGDPGQGRQHVRRGDGAAGEGIEAAGRLGHLALEQVAQHGPAGRAADRVSDNAARKAGVARTSCSIWFSSDATVASCPGSTDSSTAAVYP